VASAISSAG